MHPIRRVALPLVVLASLVTACGGDGTAPPEVADVVVTPGSAEIGVLGGTRQFTARAVDAGGQVVTGQPIEWSSSSAGVASIDDNGLATAVGEGTTTIRASAGGRSGTATLTVEVVPAAVQDLGGGQRSGEVGTELADPVVVEVRDGQSQAMAGQTVGFSASDGGSASPASVVTDASGRATTRWTLGGTAGIQRLTAVAGQATVQITATAAAGAPSLMDKIGGDGQTGIPGSTLADSLEVRVTDAFGNPAPGFAVGFSTSGGSVAPASRSTDADGRARTGLTLPSTEGQVTVTASGTGVPTVTFSATSVVEPLSITTGDIGRGRSTIGYDRTLVASGGSGSGYTFSTASGSLPSGVTLASDGRLSGTPGQQGTFSFTVRVEDDKGAQATRSYGFTVCEAPLDLDVGEVWMDDPVAPGACGPFLRSGQAGSRYRVAVVRPGTTDTDEVFTAELSVTGDGISAAPAPAPPRVSGFGGGLTPFDAMAVRNAAVRVAGTERYHMELRRQEEQMIRTLGTASLMKSASGLLRAPAAAALPDKLRIDTSTTCQSPATKKAALKLAEDDRLGIYQDSAQNAGSKKVTASQAQELLDFYRDHGEKVIEGYFGGVSDIDSNGKVVVFISPVVTNNVAAFVWSGDFFTRASCAASNEMEIIYFSADVAKEVGATDPNGQRIASQAFGTLVHEMKHVSSLYKRIQAGGYHPLFVEEGTAEIAAEMASRLAWASVAGGPAPHAQLLESHWRATGVSDASFGILLKLFRTQGTFSSQPNGIVATPIGAGSGASIYGSGWLFHRWLGDAYGNAGSAPLADSSLFRTLNQASQPSGISGIEQVTGRSWQQLMEEFAAAAMTNGQAIPQPSRAFHLYDFVSAIELFCFAIDPVDFTDSACDREGLSAGPPGAFPWPVTVDAQGVSESRSFGTSVYSGSMGASGLRVHDFVSNGTGNGAEFHLEGVSSGRVVVTRIR